MSYDETNEVPALPEPGFYYHYKHDPSGAVNNYAYEVLPSVGFHTEDDCRPIDQFMVAYRPLYPEALVYRLGKGRLHDNRPLSMFMSTVTKDGVEMRRFTKIDDELTLEKLRAIKDDMY